MQKFKMEYFVGYIIVMFIFIIHYENVAADEENNDEDGFQQRVQSHVGKGIYMKHGRRFFGEHSLLEHDEPVAQEGKVNVRLYDLPGGIVLKDVYEYEYLVNRYSNPWEYARNQTYRRMNQEQDLEDLKVRKFDLSHPSFRRDYFGRRNFLKGQVHYTFENQNTSSAFNNKAYGTVPSDAPAELRIVRKALGEIEKSSCLRFTEMSDEIKDDVKTKKIIFRKRVEFECNCHKWYDSHKQVVSLSDSCLGRRHVLHQTLHAMGFDHIHRAFDRDDFLQILWANVHPDFREEFQKKLPMQATLSCPFDYASVMAMPPSYGSSSSNVTMLTRYKKGDKMGQSQHLSRMDKYKLNLLYYDECDETVTPTNSAIS